MTKGKENTIADFLKGIEISFDGYGCWNWRNTNGEIKERSNFSFEGKITPAYRFYYELTYGPIPPGLLVCHHCDNGACVRPDHLFLGTQKDNMQDASKKGHMVHSEEANRKDSVAHKGKKLSDEHRRKMGEAHIGRKPSIEARRKISEAMKGEKHWLFGKHHSAESNKKNSESHRGEKHCMFGKHHTEETKRKIGEKAKERAAKNRAAKALLQQDLKSD
jgi:hypothetical protein